MVSALLNRQGEKVKLQPVFPASVCCHACVAFRSLLFSCLAVIWAKLPTFWAQLVAYPVGP